MPGVPSGRACEGCRKQRKKCNEAKPSCSRCMRLQITCVGSGQQRYKFQEQTGLPSVSAKSRRRRTEAPPPAPWRGCTTVTTIPRPLSNEVTSLIHQLLGAIKPSTDLTYNLSWAYGGLFDFVPKRLGISEALDASVGALLEAHCCFCTQQGKVTSQALIKYSRALSTLRVYLDDSSKARAVETLCAVFLLLVCQGMIGDNMLSFTSHCEGAAQILKARGFYNPDDPFERGLLVTLRGPVLVEGIFNRRISFTTEEWETLMGADLNQATFEGQMMHCLSRVPELMQRARNSASRAEGEGYPELADEARARYRTMKAIVAGTRAQLETAEELYTNEVKTSQPASSTVQFHALSQRLYGLALNFAILLNLVLSAFDRRAAATDSDIQDLAAEAAHFSNEILILAEKAQRYRPLGASYMRLCLLAAWGGADTEDARLAVERVLADYARDFPPSAHVVSRREIMQWSFRRLRELDWNQQPRLADERQAMRPGATGISPHYRT